MNQQPIAAFVEIGNGAEQFRLECLVKEFRIDHASVYHVHGNSFWIGIDFVFLPLIKLCLILQDFYLKLVWNLVHCDAVFALHHELLLEPELLLEILKLCHESDQFRRDQPEGLDEA